MRLHVAGPLQPGTAYTLPPAPTRHAQVRRVQPGDVLTLFDGAGCDWPARVLRVGRSQIDVQLGQPEAVARELPAAVTLAVGMPANERMDALVEKATELGMSALHPLLCERAVLRLDGDRAERRRAHWQAVAVAACEQSGRAVVPGIAPVQPLAAWLAAASPGGVAADGPATTRLVLSLRPDARPLAVAAARLAHQTATGPVLALSGPEGGLSPAEEDAARAAGFVPVTLGPRTLRADTAPLALLAWLSIIGNQPGQG